MIEPGTYVIVRSTGAGVYAGVLTSFDPNVKMASLTDARRLWRWKTVKGVSLSDLAVYGHAIGDTETRTSTPVTVDIMDVCEVIVCSPGARASIDAQP